MSEEQLDVLIIGAGPSGCVAAGYLHNKGFKIKVVEKSIFPRFVIGESLLPGCMEHFEEAGLLDCLKAEGFQEKHGARFLIAGKPVHFDFAKKFSEGWDWTWQVPRADFDHALTRQLEEYGVKIDFGYEVTNVTIDTDGTSKTTVKKANGSESLVVSKFIIDSSGHGRVLPRLLNLDVKSSIPDHSSIFTHVKDENRPEGIEGTLITFDIIDLNTWLWVIPFSNGMCSIGYVSSTQFIESLEGTPTEKLEQLMELSGHYAKRFKRIPYEFEPVMIKNVAKSVSTMWGNGFALTGNSAEFLDPVFSSGVTFATESGLMAAKLIAKELKGDKVNWQTDYENYMKAGINVFATYVKEWYTGNLQKIFSHADDNPEIKSQICAVLAGYVWDAENPFVAKHDRLVKALARVIELQSDSKGNLTT